MHFLVLESSAGAIWVRIGPPQEVPILSCIGLPQEAPKRVCIWVRIVPPRVIENACIVTRVRVYDEISPEPSFRHNTVIIRD